MTQTDTATSRGYRSAAPRPRAGAALRFSAETRRDRVHRAKSGAGELAPRARGRPA